MNTDSIESLLNLLGGAGSKTASESTTHPAKNPEQPAAQTGSVYAENTADVKSDFGPASVDATAEPAPSAESVPATKGVKAAPTGEAPEDESAQPATAIKDPGTTSGIDLHAKTAALFQKVASVNPATMPIDDLLSLTNEAGELALKAASSPFVSQETPPAKVVDEKAPAKDVEKAVNAPKAAEAAQPELDPELVQHFGMDVAKIAADACSGADAQRLIHDVIVNTIKTAADDANAVADQLQAMPTAAAPGAEGGDEEAQVAQMYEELKAQGLSDDEIMALIEQAAAAAGGGSGAPAEAGPGGGEAGADEAAIAQLVKELEAQGVPPEQIEQIIMQAINGGGAPGDGGGAPAPAPAASGDPAAAGDMIPAEALKSAGAEKTAAAATPDQVAKRVKSAIQQQIARSRR